MESNSIKSMFNNTCKINDTNTDKNKLIVKCTIISEEDENITLYYKNQTEQYIYIGNIIVGNGYPTYNTNNNYILQHINYISLFIFGLVFI